MLTVLIVGASKGLGLEWVKHYKKLGYDVIVTTRNIATAIELKKLLTGKNDRILQLDVISEDSVNLAMNQLQEAPDITIYNAGVKGYSKLPNTKVTLLNAKLIDDKSSSREAGRELAFQVNAYGFDRVMYALKDKLLTKYKATVVYISTGVADSRQNTSGGYPNYRQSKTAGESYAREWDIDLMQDIDPDSRPRIFSIIPGLVNTGMGKDIEGAVDPLIRIQEMAKVIGYVKENGDTHGVWKYNQTKHTEYNLPDCLVKKNYGINPDNASKDLVPHIYVNKHDCKKIQSFANTGLPLLSTKTQNNISVVTKDVDCFGFKAGFLLNKNF